MQCPICGQEFNPKTASQRFCSRRCERKNSFANYCSRDEPAAVPGARPIAEFVCKNCGKTVFIYSRFDQRSAYCCGKCATKHKNKLSKAHNIKKRGDNIGISPGMSLGSLIRRERRDLD